MQIRFFKIILSVSLLVPQTTYATSYYGNDFYGDIGAGVRYEQNLSRAQNSADRKETFIHAISSRIAYQNILSNKSLLNLSADVIYERVHEFKSLNNLDIAASANYFYQPIQGLYKPWIEIALELKNLKYNKSRIRDSFIAKTSIHFGKRLSRKSTALLSYSYKERFSKEEVFDLSSHMFGVNLDFDYSRNITFFASHNIQFGDTVSTATPNSKIVAAADSVAADDAFSIGSGSGCINRRCAYRLNAISYDVSAGINIAVDNKLQLELATKYFNVDASGNNRYQGQIHYMSFWYSY